MFIEDISIAAIVIDSKLIGIFLENVTRMCFIAATSKFSYMAACKCKTFLIINDITPACIVPGCAVL